jgi:hypothetical protein
MSLNRSLFSNREKRYSKWKPEKQSVLTLGCLREKTMVDSSKKKKKRRRKKKERTLVEEKENNPAIRLNPHLQSQRHKIII